MFFSLEPALFKELQTILNPEDNTTSHLYRKVRAIKRFRNIVNPSGFVPGMTFCKIVIEKIIAKDYDVCLNDQSVSMFITFPNEDCAFTSQPQPEKEKDAMQIDLSYACELERQEQLIKALNTIAQAVSDQEPRQGATLLCVLIEKIQFATTPDRSDMVMERLYHWLKEDLWPSGDPDG